MRLSKIPQIVLALIVVSAAAQAQQPAAARAEADSAGKITANVNPQVTTSNVTTTGGTNGYVPLFTGSTTVANSVIQQYNGNIGIGRAPAATLDVNGKSILRGGMDMSRLGDATPSAGATSSPLQMQSSVYNSSSKVNLLPYFQLETEPVGNNTASTGATFNFLYYSGVGSAPVETGLYVSGNGIIHFASGQTFPGTAPAASILTGLRGEPGPAGPAGPTGPAGPMGPDVSVSGTIAANRGFVSESADSSVSQFAGSNSADNAVVVSLKATGSHSYGLKASGDVGVSAEGSYLAGQFVGNVDVTGNVSQAAGSYKIDHPLDPENESLSHSNVSSPDMMNIYNGDVVTDASGAAVVTMPRYFEALNRDFRYQLTVLGGEFAQAIVGSEMSGGVFTIKTDRPNVAVSWQVTGIRQDAWANSHRLVVEEAKASNEKGRLLHMGVVRP